MQIYYQDKKEEIRFENVSFSYGNNLILKNVSFSVSSGETVAIVGQCGFGKSTMLKLCCGLLQPNAGSVYIKGRNIALMLREDLLRARLDIGYVFQNSALISNMNVFLNIALPLRYHTAFPEEKITKIVRSRIGLLKLEGYEKAMPASLSMGVMKRSAVARSLALMPGIMLYDEPTSGLDPLNAAMLIDIVRVLHGSFGVTSVIVTHDIKTALDIASRILVVAQKTLVFSGTPAELRGTSDPYIKKFMDNI
ncbi:MAG: hypothetical protein A2268_03160 [Candidatus Raymondbacteria bacterium RifOxyA12_full_50_37]|uniref:ABC transporter domain-containing protein n=1 Tax=Candidatus Raymondbacteria bacterium RIFOXYD12_FULL_49_13 TaxID=1817890 RepID=A0A1F7F879_UNCRA|nr:MAG: hypothetical protein A2268_03160 [Candidatus Raymondbacteria bacterium RifOxyA12_full_50_37]OGJ86739.1 MAG: hypothetical protein A2248_09890 [Candidatus Raymondbacteria bacterium RIFOXYA2_FULL_49_16]OGK01545.1 MAG: hypothetical protein A2350_06425 [Candidatus Raymondbacteria bacterium RifOxyB12_full_50_8]OGK02831.1 MAG: hypothetical protein A2519_06600 [Candidatus Raymondbacteria bacterium RIFOXYD12_FULL_49_13]OGP40915.1 MAG: hypothetical protein A2324_13320 [Candidatus Raymondbacteria 